eukprot:TRINITY_DN15003_c0_g1_i3.p1 TRINITY_DN15003_c0_g1~~TRINITY_DN15003_c0_g1_i3.p1  ORF type:complete len:262 (-),score=69.71 TRINITY_DN15003_c0_g1_i3:454-1239(-)
MAANCGSGVQQQQQQQASAPYSNSGTGTGTTPNSSSYSQHLKHDPGLSLVWTAEEQSILEDGLAKFANETSILRYIKVAALLREKTVRDVALRCKWMSVQSAQKKENGKRRKTEEQNSAKKLKDRKEKAIDPSLKQTASVGQRTNLSGYVQPMPAIEEDRTLSFEEIGGTTGQLLEQNAKAFEQIASNLASYRIQENISLLCRARDNITTILNDMKDMHVMSQMPPLPIALDDTLARRILPAQSQNIVLDGSNMHLKQELR